MKDEQEKEMDTPMQQPDIDSDKAADVRMADESSERLFWSLFSDDKTTGKPKIAEASGEVMRNQGPISSITMPSGWEKGKELLNVRGNSVYREFNPSDDKSCKLSYFYNGVKYGDDAARAFRDVLRSAEHKLTESELGGIAVMLRGKDNKNEFRLDSARTETVGNKKVLVVEGQYKADNVKMRAYLFPGSPAGDAVHELEYQAPEAKYDSHKDKVQKAMRSIRWAL